MLQVVEWFVGHTPAAQKDIAVLERADKECLRRLLGPRNHPFLMEHGCSWAMKMYYRRKFRSQTSDNMDRCKSSGNSQRGEEQKREDQRRESVRRKKMQVREKVGKSRNTVFFPMTCGSGGSKSRLAKAAGAEPCGHRRDEKLHALAVVAPSTSPSQNVQNTNVGPLLEVEMSKKCTPCSAHFQVKMCKAHQVRTTFGSWHVEKVHAVVARSAFPSQNVQNTFRTTLDVEMFKKCTRLWRKAHFQVKSAKNWRVRRAFGRSDVVSRGRHKGLCTLSKRWGFSSISQKDGGRRTFEEDLERCIFRGRRSNVGCLIVNPP